MNEITELRNKLRDLENLEAAAKNRIRMSKEKGFKATHNYNIYSSDDYAGLSAGEISFYYGYEETYCPNHSNKEMCWEAGCEEREWCFVATKGKEELMRIPMSELWYREWDDPQTFLLAGIAQYIIRSNNA